MSKSKIAIINYDMGNLTSVLHAFHFVGAEAIITDIKDEIEAADKLVLPGVGAFGDGMKNIERKGLDVILNQQVLSARKPMLGICLGMQLLCKESFEFGRHDGFGWIDASVIRFDEAMGLRIPHVGWNNLKVKKPNPLLDDSESRDFYFVHSFHASCRDPSDVTATCDYGQEFTAVVSRDNVFGTQFHPEKSQKAGLDLLVKYTNL